MLKSSSMFSTTVFIILISTLYTNEVVVLAEFCSKPLPYCTCVSSTHSGKVDFTCNGNDESNGVDVFGTENEIKITCHVGATSKEWYKLLKDIDLSTHGSYELTTIQECPIPEKPIKHILDLLSVEKIKTLCIDYTTDPKNNYRADHFRGLDSVNDFFFRSNNVTSFSDDALVGLWNLTNLFLNGNNLQKISPLFFQSVPKLRFLDLAGNNLTHLEVDTFKPLSNLYTLNLNGNKLRNLSRELFTPLRKLIRLDLNTNGITTFKEDIFRDVPTLEVLNLSSNNISVLPEGVLSGLKSLKSFVALRSFNEHVTTIPSGLFSGLKSLQSIRIEENKLTHLPNATFSELTRLKSISLVRNRLTKLPPLLFQETVNLEKIDLSYNRLTNVDETSFRGLGKLTELNLKYNQLSFIHENAFKDLTSLRKLDLANNRLSHLHDGVFYHLGELRVIYLNNNRMDMRSDGPTDDSVLRNCMNLQELHLRNNSVDHIFQDWLVVLLRLKLLDLSHNKLEILEPIEINFLQANNEDSFHLNLDHNNITLFNFKDHEQFVKSVSSCSVEPCEKLKHDLKISLQNNPINCDCKSYDFIRLIQGRMSSVALDYMSIEDKEELVCYQPKHMSNVKLVEVDITNLYCLTACPGNCTCQFRAADQVTVVNCTNVDEIPTWLPNNTEIELILANNKLKNLLKISSLIHSNVTKLSLSENDLENIDVLKIPHSLKVLELDNNQFSVLSTNTIEMLNQTRARISLHNNPWKCECNAQHSLNFIKNRILESLIPHGNSVTCKKNGQSIKYLSVDDLCPKFLYIICLTLAMLGTLFGAVTILYLRYEHEIKAWLFANKIFLWWVTEDEVDRDKKYDVFISYAHQDEEFVVKHLLPNLEDGPHQYKVCLHYRNWIVGDLIPEQIVRSVESSRRTIIILTRSYSKSTWANLEFRTAYLQALKERHTRLIVILLEDMDPSVVELDPELRAYITMNTYLKWGDSLFWEKLYYALPHPEYCKKLVR